MQHILIHALPATAERDASIFTYHPETKIIAITEFHLDYPKTRTLVQGVDVEQAMEVFTRAVKAHLPLTAEMFRVTH